MHLSLSDHRVKLREVYLSHHAFLINIVGTHIIIAVYVLGYLSKIEIRDVVWIYRKR